MISWAELEVFVVLLVVILVVAECSNVSWGPSNKGEGGALRILLYSNSLNQRSKDAARQSQASLETAQRHKSSSALQRAEVRCGKQKCARRPEIAKRTCASTDASLLPAV